MGREKWGSLRDGKGEVGGGGFGRRQRRSGTVTCPMH